MRVPKRSPIKSRKNRFLLRKKPEIELERKKGGSDKKRNFPYVVRKMVTLELQERKSKTFLVYTIII
jgi:hypothetical protein